MIVWLTTCTIDLLINLLFMGVLKMKAWVVNVDNDIIDEIEDLPTSDIVFANTKKEAREKVFRSDTYFDMWNLLKEELGQDVHKKEVQLERAPYADDCDEKNLNYKDFTNLLRKNGWTFYDD